MVEPSKELQLVFDKAIKDAQKLRHEYVTLEHILFSMLCEDNFIKLLNMYGADVNYIKSNLEHHLKTQCDDIILPEDIKKFKPKKWWAYLLFYCYLVFYGYIFYMEPLSIPTG